MVKFAKKFPNEMTELPLKAAQKLLHSLPHDRKFSNRKNSETRK